MRHHRIRCVLGLIVFNFSSSSVMPMMEVPLGCDGRSIRVAGKTSAIGAGAAHDSRRPASAIASRQWSPSPNTSGKPASAAKRMLRRRHGEGARRQLCRYVGDVLREIPADMIDGIPDQAGVVVAGRIGAERRRRHRGDPIRGPLPNARHPLRSAKRAAARRVRASTQPASS